MKIAVFSYCFAPYEFGGGERSTRLLSIGLSKLGHKILILSISPASNHIGYDNIDGLDVYRGKLDNLYYHPQCRPNVIMRTLWHAYNQSGFYAYRDFIKVLNRFSPDIVLLSHFSGFSHSLINHVRQNVKVPFIYTGRDYSLIDMRTTCFRHGRIVVNDFVQKCSTIGRRKSARLIDWFVFNSKRTQEIHENVFPWMANRSSVIYTDPPTEHVKERRFNNTPPKRVLILGKVSKEKGVLKAVKSIISEPELDVLLTVAGDGPDVKSLNDLCHIDSRISYVGKVKGSAKNQLLESADILIQPSEWEEPYPRVILEAFNNSCFVIATNIGGNSELVGANRGMLYDPSDVNGLTNSVRYALGNTSFVEGCLSNARYFLACNRENEASRLYAAIFQQLLERKLTA
jgi:glycosyltransferase involved in cell wall biosynthesis